MARLLVYTSPARGHLYPLMPTLLELRRRGHELAVRTLASEVPKLQELGFEAGPIDPAVEAIEHDDFKAKSPFAANRRVLRVFAERGRFEVDDVRAAIEEFDPDGLIIDISTEGAAAVAERSGLPWAHYTPYFAPLPSADAPPFGLGLAPARGPLGRARDQLIRRFVLERLLRAELPLLNEVRDRVGVQRLSGFDDLWRRAPLHLYFTAEPFEYPRSDWPPSFRLVGPGEWEPPTEVPAWVAEIDGPIILVTCSSEFQGDERLVQTAVTALRDEPYTVVATTAAIDPQTIEAPPNARVVRFAPHGPLLEHAACVVCHGGMGITQKALLAGVPLCVVPFGRDQLEVAGHVVHRGVGTRVFPQLLRPARLRTAVRRAIERREAAERMGAALRSQAEQHLAARAVEDLVAAA